VGIPIGSASDIPTSFAARHKTHSICPHAHWHSLMAYQPLKQGDFGGFTPMRDALLECFEEVFCKTPVLFIISHH
jgi:hypothetical protein